MKEGQTEGQHVDTVQAEESIGITEVSKEGRIIKLEDGSEWHVYFMDSIRSCHWRAGSTRVIVREGIGYPFPYVAMLERADSGQMVNVRKIEKLAESRVDTQNNRQDSQNMKEGQNEEKHIGTVQPEESIGITEVLKEGRVIKLEDGSEWHVFYMDSIRSTHWRAGSTRVIVREGIGYPFPYKTALERADSGHRVSVKKTG